MDGDDADSRSAMSWLAMSEVVKRSVESKFALSQHHFDGESRFITQILERCIKEDPVLRIDGQHYRYQMTLGRFYVDRPNIYDPSLSCQRPIYPHEASWKDANYVCKVKLGIVFEVLSKDVYDLSENDGARAAPPALGNRPSALHHMLGRVSPHVSPVDQEETTTSTSLLDQLNANRKSHIVDENNPHPRLQKRRPTTTTSAMDLDEEIEHLLAPDASSGQPPAQKTSTCHIVEESASFIANIGDFYSQINGEMCNVRTAGGMMCHSDPDVDGGFHVVQGADKVTESQFTVRGNYIYVHFQNSSTSQSQSATAAEASNTDKSATADSPIILACDYRPTNESLFKFTAAFHIFLMVETPRRARMMMGRRVETAPQDSEAISPMSSPSMPITSSITNNTTSKPMRGYWGYGENANVSFPNIKQTNFNLVLIMFLLGLDSRNDMINCIIPDEVHLLRSAGLLDDSETHPVLKDLPEQSSSHTRQSYLVYNEVFGLIHNQKMFPAEYTEDPGVYRRHLPEQPQTFRTWLYDDLASNHMPFVGHEDAVPSGDDDKTSQMWFRPDDFAESYAKASIDGWDRTSVLAHIVWTLTHPATKPTPADKKRASAAAPQHLQHVGAPSAAEMKKFQVCLQRFTKSFVEEFLPHLGRTAHWRVVTTKTSMLGLVVRKLMLVYMGYIEPDNVDDLVMKRMETPGHLMARVFRTAFTKGVYKFMRQAVDRIEQCVGDTISSQTNLDEDGAGGEIDDEPAAAAPPTATRRGSSRPNADAAVTTGPKPLARNMRVSWPAVALASFIQHPFTSAMVRGMWSSGGPTVMDVSGSTKRLQATNVATHYERIRGVRHLMNKKGATRLKDNSAQLPDDSQLDRFCPQRTHNDNQAGLDIHLARAAHVRIGYETGPLLGVVMRGAKEKRTSPFFNHFRLLHSTTRTSTSPTIPPGCIHFMINGHNVGFTDNPVACVKALKLARYHRMLPFDVSISWWGGPIGCDPANPLIHPMFHFIHLSGDWGSVLKPCIDMDHIWKLPSLLLRYSTASGVFPNLALLGPAVEYAHLEPHPRDYGSALHLPMCGDVAMESGALFNALVSEGVVVYRDAEEMRQEYSCPSFRDFTAQAPDYMERSHAAYWDSYSAVGCAASGGGAGKSLSVPELVSRTLDTSLPTRNAGNGVNFKWTVLSISEELMLGVTASLAPFTNANDTARGSYSTGFTTQASAAASLNHEWKHNPYPLTVLEPKTSLAPNSLSNTYSVMGTASAATESITAFYSRAHNGEDAIELSASPLGRYGVRHQYIVKCSALSAPREDVAIPAAAAAAAAAIESPSAMVISSDDSSTAARAELKPTNIPINSHAFSNPTTQPCVTLKSSDYTSISADGMPIVGGTVPPSGALVGCVLSVGRSDVFRDGTKTNQSRMSLRVDEFTQVHQGVGSSMDVTVKASCIRPQENADKLSTFPGQKGVVGVVIARYDCPYIMDVYGRGVIPSFYRGAEGVASRATMAENRAKAHAARCIAEGRALTVSPWGRDFDMWNDVDCFAPSFGSQVMVNPDNGATLLTRISVGMLDYRMMHHLARETFNARTLGAVDPRTGQPTEGAKKKGGAREGSLEAFNKTSQGATEVSEQLLFSASDPGFGHVCQRCGLVGDTTVPSFLGEVLKAFEPDNVVRWFDHDLSDTESLRMAVRKANRYARSLKVIQCGSDVDCVGKRWIMTMLDRYRNRSNIGGTLVLPGGGYCPGCRSVSDVYAVKVPQILHHLLANSYMPGLAWRFVLDVKGILGDLGKGDLGDHLGEVLVGAAASGVDRRIPVVDWAIARTDSVSPWTVSL